MVVNTVVEFTASPCGMPEATLNVASLTGPQVPLEHVPPWQLWPHEPQLAPSLESVAQALVQTVWPARHSPPAPPIPPVALPIPPVAPAAPPIPPVAPAAPPIPPVAP